MSEPTTPTPTPTTPEESNSDVKGQTTLDSLVSDITENEPKVNEDVVAHLQGKSDGESESVSNDGGNPSGSTVDKSNGTPDSGGNSGTSGRSVNTGAFNPAIHATDSNGNPVLKTDGTYAKKRGPKKGGTNANLGGHSVGSGGNGVSGRETGTQAQGNAETQGAAQASNVNYPQMAGYVTGIGFMGAESFL